VIRAIMVVGLPPPHQGDRVEFPWLIAIGPEPIVGGVAPFILETHRDAVLVKAPKLLDQTIVELFRPFARQEVDDGRAALQKFGPVAPATVLGVGAGDLDRIAPIPGVFGEADFLGRGFEGERRQRRAAVGHLQAPDFERGKLGSRSYLHKSVQITACRSQSGTAGTKMPREAGFPRHASRKND